MPLYTNFRLIVHRATTTSEQYDTRAQCDWLVKCALDFYKYSLGYHFMRMRPNALLIIHNFCKWILKIKWSYVSSEMYFEDLVEPY